MSRLRSPSLILAGLTLILQACHAQTETNTPVAELHIVANPAAINDQGAATTLTITATDAAGAAGTGSVDLSAAAGVLSPATVTLASGGATATYTCDVHAAAGCTGQVRIIGRWNNVTSGAFVAVGAQASTDGGTDGGSGGSGTDAGVPPGAATSIGWASSKCGGQDCHLLGVKGSGFNEQAQVAFLVQDAVNIPVPDVSVAFTLIDAPAGTVLEAASAPTNSNGLVVARVLSGPVIGAFTVRATVTSPALTAVSPTLGVRGAKPSNRGFTFQCEKVNVDVWTTAQPPKLQTVSCSVGLVDRYNNPVGTGTSVFFKTESGTITNNVSTTAFDPKTDNVAEGTATVAFHTGPGGSFPPLDVAPFPADATQWPYARISEPSVSNVPSPGVPAVQRNPRDQLVTVLAYVQGEEHFWDDDADGIHDATERFIDQGEPFVDTNDNNAWDPGEVFIDTNSNNVWDGPNGVWDANSTIWTERRLLFTGYVDPSVSMIAPSSFSGSCGTGLPNDTSLLLLAYLRDSWLNLPTSGSTVAISHVATKGSVTLLSGSSLLDSYGFGYDRVVVDNTTGHDCTPASAICKWKTVFFDWPHPVAGQINGAPGSDVTACVPDQVEMSITVQSVKGSTFSGGSIE